MLRGRSELYNGNFGTATSAGVFLVENMIIKRTLIVGDISNGVNWTKYIGQEIVNKQKSGVGR